MSFGVDLGAFNLANDYIDVVIKRQELLDRIAELEHTLKLGYTEGSPYIEYGIEIRPTHAIDKDAYRKEIHALQLQARALGFDVTNFANRLQADYGDMQVPSVWWPTGPELPSVSGGGRGPKALIKLALDLRYYTGNVKGLESAGGGPIDLIAFGAAGSLQRLAALEFAMPQKVAPSVVRFFYDPRKFSTISKDYWKERIADGASLHHWLIPQRWKWVHEGIRNAGFNLLEVPALRGVFHPTLDLNTWMGFATSWGGSEAVKAGAIEWGIRLAIPGSLFGGGYLVLQR